MSLADLNKELSGYLLMCAILGLLSMGSWYLMSRFVVQRLDIRPRAMSEPLWRKLLLGTVLGLIALWIMLWPPMLGGAFHPDAPGYSAFPDMAPGMYRGDPQLAIGTLGADYLLRFFLVQSFFEELLFRAFAFCLLATGVFAAAARFLRPDHVDPRWMQYNWLFSGLGVNLLVSGSFAFAHSGNPDVTPLALVNIALASLMLGQLFWNQASVGGVGMLHTTWNLGIALLGLPVSGIVVTQPVIGNAQGSGQALISGGGFGPEGGLCCTAALLMLIAYLLWQALPADPTQAEAALAAPAVLE